MFKILLIIIAGICVLANVQGSGDGMFAAFDAEALSSTQASTLTVCPNGCDFSSIQTAIDTANPGDTIEVHNGTYYENVNVNKKLILRGIGMPVVDARGKGSPITLSEDYINLSGIKSINPGNLPEAEIKILSSGNKIFIQEFKFIKNSGTYVLMNLTLDNILGVTWYNGLHGTEYHMPYGNLISDEGIGYFEPVYSPEHEIIGAVYYIDKFYKNRRERKILMINPERLPGHE